MARPENPQVQCGCLPAYDRRNTARVTMTEMAVQHVARPKRRDGADLPAVEGPEVHARPEPLTDKAR
jgi:hypothetical protein